jgi:thioester reductase-like protein
MCVLTRGSGVFLTGVTGLIGGEVLRALLDFGVRKIWTLVRPSEGTDCCQKIVVRLRRSGVELDGAAKFVHAVAGDMRQGGLGLSGYDLDGIRSAIDLIIHCAGETSFIRETSCVDTNVVGMRNVVELAWGCKRCPLVVFVSTAANCGSMAHACLREGEGCNPHNGHHNEYTRTKAVAERMLMDSGLPYLVVRPSIVLSAGLPDRTFAK